MDTIRRFFTFAAMQTFKTSKSKENILAKIRKQLNAQSVPMPYPELEKKQSEQIYASSPLTDEETFAEQFSQLGGKFVFCSNENELIDNIHTLYESRGWRKLLCSEERLLKIFRNNKLNIAEAAEERAEEADACITGCEALIARTGSVIISSRQNMGRTSTVFYPVHIIVAYTEQILPDIQQGIEAMKKRYGKELPSMINLNTGPSRTADIEKTLVVGVHGPGEVFCFYVNTL